MADEEKDPEETGDAPEAGAEAEDAEGVEGEEGEESEGKSGSKKKLIMFVLLGVLVLAGAGAGLYFTGMLDSVLGGGEQASEGADGHGESAGGEHGGGHGGTGGVAFLEIPAMIVNLNTEDGVPRYLRLNIQLELENQEDLHAVEAVMPRVVDQFQTYLRELRVRDLRGSAGIYRLQMELLWRVNQAAAPVKVKDVLFQEILIQ